MLDNLEFIFVKSNDVLTYIKQEIVDIGIVGGDTLLENTYKDYYNIFYTIYNVGWKYIVV